MLKIKNQNIEMIPPVEELDEQRREMVHDRDPAPSETSMLIRSILTRVREVVAIVILLVAVFAIIFATIMSLFKQSGSTGAMEDTFKLLNTLNNLQAAHGAFAFPNIGAIQSNNSWNATTS